LLSLLCNLQVQHLISELNEILAHGAVDETGIWKKKLQSQSQALFELFPQAIQEQLLLERDPHGNVHCSFVLNCWIVVLNFNTFDFIPLGCQDRNRENAHSNGGN
jgi:hypothetical protein